jgi:drug/metabolite transporter (DMT)-like permease
VRGSFDSDVVSGSFVVIVGVVFVALAYLVVSITELVKEEPPPRERRRRRRPAPDAPAADHVEHAAAVLALIGLVLWAVSSRWRAG